MSVKYDVYRDGRRLSVTVGLLAPVLVALERVHSRCWHVRLADRLCFLLMDIAAWLDRTLRLYDDTPPPTVRLVSVPWRDGFRYHPLSFDCEHFGWLPGRYV